MKAPSFQEVFSCVCAECSATTSTPASRKIHRQPLATDGCKCWRDGKQKVKKTKYNQGFPFPLYHAHIASKP